MTALPELHSGDRVLVRAEVFMVGTGRCAQPYLRFNAGLTEEAGDVDIVTVESASFRPGDTVIADGHRATIIALHAGHAWLDPIGRERTNDTPWQVESERLRRPPADIEIAAESGHVIADLRWNGLNEGPRGHANATLITTAPDLYEALDNVPLPSTQGGWGEYIQRFYPWLNGQRDAALAKARGEVP